MNSREYYLNKRNVLSNADMRNVKEYSFEELDSLNIKNVHFTAVCGKAMASVAGMLIEAGYKVTGSDNECYPPMSDVVSESGICYQDGFSGENLTDADVVIIGNACTVDNIEAKAARDLGKPQLSVAQALHYFCIRGKKSIVVTGTHGKTTTTSYLAQALNVLENNTSFMVGGVLKSTNKSYAFNQISKYIVIEGDEYDSAYFDKRPKFFHYDPYVLIITSIEFDHADIYSDFEDYKNAFRMLLEEKKKSGVVVACIDDKNVAELIDKYEGNLITYGIDNKIATLSAKNIVIEKDFQSFDVFEKGNLLCRLEIPLFGDHNIRNALAVFASSRFLGFEIAEIVREMKTFAGVKQRQEILYAEKDIFVIDDYAHHPTAVRETLIGLRRQYPDKRIVSVFEPRSTTSRKRIYEKDYTQSFTDSDETIIKSPSLRSQDNPEDVFSAERVCESLKEARSFNTTDEILEYLKQNTKRGDVVAFMSNGSFDGVQHKFVEYLKNL